MIIGFDASRAFISERTGTENYSYNILVNLLQTDRRNAYKIYLRLPSAILDKVADEMYKGKSKKERIAEWVESVRKQLPPTQNYRLIVIKNKWLWTQVGLARELWKYPPDVLFVPAHTLPVIRRKKIKTVVTIHDLGYEYLPQYHQFPQKLWLNRSTEYAVKHADRLVAVSEATKEDLINKLKAEEKKISVIYEGFGWDSPSKQTIQKPGITLLSHYGLQNDYLLFIGTIQPRKNLVRLIQAFAEVVKSAYVQEHLPTLQLVLMGKKGWLHEDIFAEPARSGVSDRVKFLGHVPDTEAISLLKGAKCFVYPSLFEGFGIPIIEAQSVNTVVVTSKKKPMTEVGGDACEYVDPESVEDIARGIERVLKDRMYADSLRKKGFFNVQRFSWKKASEETLRVLEK